MEEVSVSTQNSSGQGGRITKRTQLGGENNGGGRAKLHGETTRRRVESQAVTKVAHDVVAVSPKTDGDGGTTVDARGSTMLAAEVPREGK